MSAPTLLAVVRTADGRLRAQQLLEGIPDASVLGPLSGPGGIVTAATAVAGARPDVLYLVDVGKSTVPLAVLGRLLRRRVVVDTGDVGFALARSLGERGFISLLLVGLGEALALRCADEIVVRGRAHAAHVPRPATHIPDLAPRGTAPQSGAELRRSLGLEDAFVVGLVGSLNLSARRKISYGWDLIEALPHADGSVHALVVGDGTGLQPLRARAAALGVADRCRFVGRVSVEQVGAYIGAMNAAISTQTNDLVGQVRTTGKLPLYLASGCPVIASDVGEAAVLLGPHGWTLSYSGVVDRSYPRRLAAAIEAWRRDPDGEPARRQLALRIAAESFDPGRMRGRIEALIARLTAP